MQTLDCRQILNLVKGANARMKSVCSESGCVCGKFVANRLKRNLCADCMHLIARHAGTTDEEQAAGVLAGDDRHPMRVDDGLYIGSMMAAMNNDALSKAGTFFCSFVCSF